MKRYVKVFFGFLFILIFILGFTGCVKPSEDDEKEEGLDEEFLTKEEAVKKLTNYSFAYQISYVDKDETTVLNITDIRTEDAWQYGDADMLFVADMKTESMYMLNQKEKTGMLTDLDKNMNAFSDWGSHLFNWHENVSSFKKIKNEKVVNRLCIVYEVAYGTIKYTYYIDREYDLCLKYEIIESSQNLNTTFTFTSFKVGGVTANDVLKVLEDYQIDDYRTK